MAALDRIKFDATSDDILVWKYPSEELRLGSQLIVNQAQEAIFVKSGKALDLFGPGRHTLETYNIPLLGKFVNMPFGNKTPFAAEIWFVTKTVKRNLKWGTPGPIPILDPLLNYLINVRAFGQWGIRIKDTRTFITELVGSLPSADNEKVIQYFIGEIVQKLSNSLSELFTKQKVSIVEANSRLNELAASVSEAIKKEFGRFGIEIINFNVERINIPEEDTRKIQEVLAKKMEMEQLGSVKVGQGYVTARTFDTLEKAAENQSVAGSILAGGLGLGVGLGGGVHVGKEMGESLDVGEPGPHSSAVKKTSLKATKDTSLAKMKKIKKMRDAGLISQQEYEQKKKQILDAI